MTARWGLVKAHDHVVCIQQIHDSFVIKIVRTAIFPTLCIHSPEMPGMRWHTHHALQRLSHTTTTRTS